MHGWTNAEWIDPARPWTNPLPVPELPDDERAIDEVQGIAFGTTRLD